MCFALYISIMARPWVWFRWCDLVHKKAIPASFLHHVIAGRHERILPTQADSLRLLRRLSARRNIVSLQSNKITIRKNLMKSTGLAMQKSAADGYAWATAPLPVTCTWVRHKIGDFNLYTSGGGCTVAAPYVSF